jgi:hypothetical protein
MHDDIVLAKLPRQDRAIVVVCASAIFRLGWALSGCNILRVPEEIGAAPPF